mmetsp:Transcript_108990/g.243397  ORF Transcript_108990/g.243397 Transcript_108990/m.243397 type:complete len:377 (+) Transcript_108990:123-1253(+)
MMQRPATSLSLPSLASPKPQTSPPAAYGTMPMSPVGQAQGPAANFLPKLLSKLSSIDEKLTVLQQSKVDVTMFERQMDASRRREDSLAEDVRQLQADVAALKANADEVRASLQKKAEVASLMRTNERLQELTGVVRGKTNEQFSQQLAADLAAAHQRLEQAFELLNTKTTLTMFEEAQVRLDGLSAAVKARADLGQFQQLRSEAQATQAHADRMQQILNEKADKSALGRTREHLQELTDTVRGKADAEKAMQLQADVSVLEANSANMQQQLDKKASLEAHTQLREEVTGLGTAMRMKAEGSVARQLVADMQAASLNADRMQQVLDGTRRDLHETSQRVKRMGQQQDELQELSTALAKSKADADKVPHLQTEMLGQL